MSAFKRRGNPYMLVLGMTSVKMGDRLVQIGCADASRLAAVAAKVGLSGRAAVVVPDQGSASRAEKAAARAGVLVEIEVAPPTRLPFEAAAFDVAVIDDTGGLMATMEERDRAAMVREAARILVPGGRVMVIGRAARGGFSALLRGTQPPPFDPEPALQADGFKAVRRLAEREGLLFVEGLKQRV